RPSHGPGRRPSPPVGRARMPGPPLPTRRRRTGVERRVARASRGDGEGATQVAGTGARTAFGRSSGRLKPRGPAADSRVVTFDFADLLLDVIARRAPDLHLTAGAPPMVRVRGRLAPLEGYAKLSTTDTREVVHGILPHDQRQNVEKKWTTHLH